MKITQGDIYNKRHWWLAFAHVPALWTDHHEPNRPRAAASIFQDGPSTGTSSEDIAPLVTGWRSTCECGWTGKTFYPARPSDDGDYPTDIEDGAKAEWRDHMAPLEAIDSVAHAAEASRKANELLDNEVKFARAAGATWSAIGAAVQISRQSAHEHWSSKWGAPPPPPSPLSATRSRSSGERTPQARQFGPDHRVVACGTLDKTHLR